MTKKPDRGRLAPYKQLCPRMSDPQLTYNQDGVTVIRLTGEYDIYRQEELDRELRQAYEARIAVLDVSPVTYMDSTAFAVLVRLKKRMSERGPGVIRIAGPAPNVRRVLELTRLDEVFEVFDSLDEAMREK